MSNDEIRVFAVVKESSMDVEGLPEFVADIFASRPIYGDTSYAFYHALGDRKVGLSHLLNPTTLLAILRDTFGLDRLTLSFSPKSQKKTPPCNTLLTKGDGIVQGGIIIFGANGKPFCMYPEETGNDLRVADILSALAALRMQQSN